MKTYETVVILKSSTDTQYIEKEIQEKIEDTVRKNDGKILNVEKWGIRKLAYAIRKQEEGFYILLNYTATPETIKVISRFLRIDENVLRQLTLKITAEELNERLKKEEAKKTEEVSNVEPQKKA